MVVTHDGATLVTAGSMEACVWDLRGGRKPLARLQHQSPVSRIAVTSDGRLLLSSSGCKIFLWDLETLALTPGWQVEQEDDVTDLAVTRDGTWLVSGGVGGEVRLWDLQARNSSPAVSFKHGTTVSSVVVTPDGRWLLSGGNEGLNSGVLLWSMPGNQPSVKAPDQYLLHRFRQGSTVRSMALTPCGTWLLSGDASGDVCLWNLRARLSEPSARFRHDVQTRDVVTGRDAVTGLATTSDGAWLLGSFQNNQVSIWDLKARETLPAARYVHSGELGSFTLTPDGALLLVSDGGARDHYKVFVWDVQMRASQPAVHMEQQLGTVSSLTVAANSSWAASAHEDRSGSRVCVWNLDARSPTPSRVMQHSMNVSAVLATPDGLLLSGGGNASLSEVLLWDPTARRAGQLARFARRGDPVSSLAVSPDGSWLFAGGASAAGDEGEVVLWDLASRSPEPLRVFRGQSAVASVAVTPDKKWLVGGGAFGICRWSLEAEAPEPPLCFSVEAVHSMAVTADGLWLLSAGGSGEVRLWDLGTGASHACWKHGLQVQSVSVTQDGRWLLTGGSGSWVHLWDLQTVQQAVEQGRVALSCQTESRVRFKHWANMVTATMAPAGDWFFSGGENGQVLGWFAGSTADFVQMLQLDPWCEENNCTASAIAVRGAAARPFTMPNWFDATPVQTIDLHGAVVEAVAPLPPVSLVTANFSGAHVHDWSVMTVGWFSRPVWLDLRGANDPLIPTIVGQATRRITDLDCVRDAQLAEVCLTRSAEGTPPCATSFQSRDMSALMLYAFHQGKSLYRGTMVHVDLEPFEPWLCDCPEGSFGPNGSSCSLCPEHHYCPPPGNSSGAANSIAHPCQAGSDALQQGQSECQCARGWFVPTSRTLSANRGYACQLCPAGRFSKHDNSTTCQPCTFPFEVEHGMCATDWSLLDVLLLILLGVYSLCWVVRQQVCGISIEDVHLEGGTVIVRTCGPHRIHCLLGPVPVDFHGTGHPGLDSPEEPYLVEVRGRARLHLLHLDHAPVKERRDASQGVLHVRAPYLLVGSGRYVPSGASALLIFVCAFVAGTQFARSMAAIFFPIVVVGGAAIVVHCMPYNTPKASIQENLRKHRSHLAAQNPRPQGCGRGPERAVSVLDLRFLYEAFKSFIGDRDMYYVNSNIIKPLTKQEQLSFAELAGPKITSFFVSHFWGMPFQHFVDSIVRHAQTVPSGVPQHYWVCSLSNNQWRVTEELGTGDWAQSSFYLALTRGACRATVMAIDEDALPLSRVWCLFEVFQTFILSRTKPGFEGLLLATPCGVLNTGAATSVDLAMKIAERLASLQVQEAEATEESDKRMILDLVNSYEGGCEAVNQFIRYSIRSALLHIRSHHNRKFERLMSMLERTALEDATEEQVPPVHSFLSAELTLPVTSGLSEGSDEASPIRANFARSVSKLLGDGSDEDSHPLSSAGSLGSTSEDGDSRQEWMWWPARLQTMFR